MNGPINTDIMFTPNLRLLPCRVVRENIAAFKKSSEGAEERSRSNLREHERASRSIERASKSKKRRSTREPKLTVS